nr:MAG TPA: hypothetical protein [Bacteriophage sp.]
MATCSIIKHAAKIEYFLISTKYLLEYFLFFDKNN